MKFTFIKVILEKIDDRLNDLECWIDSRRIFIRALCVGIAAWSFSVFFYTLQFFYIGVTSGRASDFIKMCSNPLARDLAEPILAYRIVTPTIAWLIGLHNAYALVLPPFFMIMSLSVIYVICYRKIDRTTAILTTLGISFTQVTLWSNGHVGIPDAVTHLASALCLLSTNIWVISGVSLLGIMNDERFVLAMPFIMLWNINVSNKRLSWLSIRKISVGLTLGLLVSLILRHALTAGWIGDGIPLPQVYTDIVTMFANSIKFFWSHKFWYTVNYFMSFRWLWIIPIVCFFISFNKYRWYFICLWLSMFAVIFASSLVWDVSRSIAFSYPAVLIAVRYLYECNLMLCRKLLIVSILLCLGTPAFFLGPGGMQLYLPLPFILLKMLTGFDIVDLVRTRGRGTFGIH